MKPDAYALRNDQGYWVGLWSSRETAESAKAKGQPSHNEQVVALKIIEEPQSSNQPTERTTMNAPEITLPAIGQPFAGGFFGGRFFIREQPYALIVSPKADGEIDEIAWNKNTKPVAGATHYADGLANTRAMLTAGSPLAQQITALRIGGFDDWHIPSRLQSLVLFGELRDLPAFAEDQPEGLATEWYWTSTQHASDDDYAWCQRFYDGGQDSSHKKYGQLRARAVRMIKI